MRERKKEQRRRARAALEHAAAAHAALQRSAYDEVIFEYQQAAAKADSIDDKAGYYFHTGIAYTYSSRPHLATPWLERAVEAAAKIGRYGHAASHIRYLARQPLIELRTPDALPLLERAHEYFALSDARKRKFPASFTQRTDAMISACFTLVGRYEEADERFWMKRSPGVSDPTGRILYRNQRGILNAAHGRAEEAFSNFEIALRHSQDAVRGYYTTAVLDDYATWATALGRIDIARACYERALLVARDRRLMWRIPYFSFRLASLLIVMGNYNQARLLITDANSYDSETPVLRFLQIVVQLQLLLATEDSVTGLECDKDVVEMAFRSGEPQRIATVAALQIKIALLQGKIRYARRLLARALPTIPQADNAGDLLALGAYGLRTDAERSRSLLASRVALPNNGAAKAYLALWEAYSAQSHRVHDNNVTIHAQRAAGFFKQLGFRRQEEEALRLIGQHDPKMRQERDRGPALFGNLDPALTQREQEVAELALQGLSNRVISEQLSISERTVESHMTSVLNRLGFRSRWQLAQLLPK